MIFISTFMNLKPCSSVLFSIIHSFFLRGSSLVPRSLQLRGLGTRLKRELLYVCIHVHL